MSDIGQELREARERQGLTFEDVTTRTMIPRKYLQALEEEQFDLFPGEVYFKGALRKYAVEVGLNPQELFDRLSPKPPEEFSDVVEQKITAQTTVKTGRSKRDIQVLGTGKNFNPLKLLLILLIVFLIGSGAYVVMRELNIIRTPEDNPPITDEQPEDDNTAPQQGGENTNPQPQEPTPDETEDQEPEPPAVTVERDTTTSDVRFIVRNAENIQAVMTFSGGCWTRVTADGTQVFSETVAAGQTRETSAGTELSIRLGNPPAFSLSINGQQVQLPAVKDPYTLSIIKQ